MTSSTAPKSPSSTLPMPESSPRLKAFLESSRVQQFILVLILVNAVTLGLETSASIMARAGSFLHILDRTLLAVFVTEIVLRLYAHRLAFFKDPWSVFDFFVVGIALLPATGQFSILRALRVLRVLRVLTIVPSMRRVVGALLAAVPGLVSIALVLLLFYYVGAVVTTKMFGAAFPEWFGNIGRSLYTLFQVMTLESWSMGISRPVMERFPYAWAFFVPFILMATFTMLNLFIAVIVNAMQTFSESEQAGTRVIVETTVAHAREHIEADLHSTLETEVRGLRAEIAELKDLLKHR
jgi:voltage-gated sodium channel